MGEHVLLGVRTGAIDPGVLHEGVPSWLRQSLWDWIDRALQVRAIRSGYVEMQLSAERLREIERVCQVSLDWEHNEFSAVRSLKDSAGPTSGNHERFLWAVDFLCSLPNQAMFLDKLDKILREGGSAWRVSTEGTPHLERRVPEGVVEAAKAAMAKGDAGRILSEAWRESYGVRPDRSEAYRHAVRAIETAAHGTVTPTNPKATLGTMIKAMRDEPSNWTVTTEGKHPVETVISMMDTVWTGHTDRHGAKGGPRELAAGAADVAVAIAVSLVSLFEGDSIKHV